MHVQRGVVYVIIPQSGGWLSLPGGDGHGEFASIGYTS
jgi:hypothetical protein